MVIRPYRSRRSDAFVLVILLETQEAPALKGPQNKAPGVNPGDFDRL